MKVITVILAGGSGNRFGADKPKQFIEVNGRTILEWSVRAFASHPLVDEVCVVSRQDWVSYVQYILQDEVKVRHIIPGGKERYHSTLAALDQYFEDDDLLLIHDAVRPMIDADTITACITALKQGDDACAVGVPTTDTIWQSADQAIAAIPPRNTLWNAQTPQCFRRSLLRRAFDLALADPSFLPTDDCGVVKRYCPESPIRIIQGRPTNIKITYAEDLELAKRFLMD